MRKEKQLLLDEIRSKIDSSKAMLIVRYDKMPSKTAHDFRSAVYEAGAEFEVVRKRVFGKAAEALGIQLDVDTFGGHVGVVFVKNDPIDAAKAAFKFGQENDQMLKVLGGRVEGRFYVASDVEKLSKLPSLPEMRAQLLGLFEAPMAQTLSVIDALLCSVVFCLDNKSKEEQ